MVAILSVIFFNHPKDQDPVILHSCYNLTSVGFFQVYTVKEIILFASRETAKRCPPGESLSVTHLGYHAHAHLYSIGLSVCCVTDAEYQTYTARAFLTRAVNLFRAKYPDPESYTQIVRDRTNVPLPVPDLEALLTECQDPNKVDQLTNIRNDLAETHKIIEHTMETLLLRGESLKELIEKSNDLSYSSKTLAEKAEEMNACSCTLL